jgi:recombination protein RecA
MSSVAVFSPTELPSLVPDGEQDEFSARRVRAVGALSSSVRPASALEVRPAPAMVPFGIDGLDALTGGVPRGALTELFGPASSGRTSVMLSLMASVTRRQEVCALIDVTDSFDPASGAAAGIDLRRLLWVRCGTAVSSFKFQGSATPQRNPERRPATMREAAPPAKNISWSIHENYDSRLRHAITGGCFEMTRKSGQWTVDGGQPISSFKLQVTSPQQQVRNSKPETRNFISRNSKPETQNFSVKSPTSKWTKLDQALKATDLLLQSGGFGLIVIDLGDISIEQARRIPLTSWFRFRRVVENTPTILLLIARDSCAKTCASLVLQLNASGQWTVHGEPKPEARNRQLNSGSLSTVHRPHTNLLDGLEVRVELIRTRLERKPVRSTGSLQTQTLWKRSG